ncbi:MAG: methyltransferase domain-containing protein [Chloroflexi bacterium]|nr:methyltransferase domain-containing protein [Chloroflexota bacterium]MCI0575616.1 methyltransferase domain-containing protein [Chloroflexota bacterium]MCI0645047.1 methyltransferase domain-containing protein [Chloroflexota bacterium]MCI0731883.1 methyltransferase domain-containing protein [Chloroflexota bacterium]
MMETNGRLTGTRYYLQVHWPTYLFGYGGGALLLLALVGLSLVWGRWVVIPLVMAGLMLLSYFCLTSLWAAHRLYDNNALRDTVFDTGNLGPEDNFVHVSLGLRRTAVRFSRRLTSGQVTVVEVYNPQLAPGRDLARAHRQAPPPPDDPRLAWREGQITLLPLPDSSTPAVTVSQALSELWQHGDRLCLLREIYRILAPGGRLLLVERVRTPTNWLVMGPAAINLPPADYWRQLLVEAGFQIKKERTLFDLVICFRADKPLPGQARQLVFDF